MPPKRPQLEQLQIVPEENKGVSITDTMTLVVKVDDRTEVRVKQTGLTGPGTSEKPVDALTPQSVMNKINFDDLRTGQELGKGSQGKVRIAQNRVTGEKYALKYIPFEEDTEETRMSIAAELRQVAAVKHKNVVCSYEAYFRDGRLYVLMEYMDAGTMNDIIKRHTMMLPEEILAYIARELFQGLEYLHGRNMIHRDIKPANILANSKGEVKISDFGVAKTFSGGADLQTLSAQGSIPYQSPERINSKPYSFNCDIWSAGLSIAECALGQYPFYKLKSRIFDLCQAIATNKARVDWDGCERKFSEELRNFVDVCLSPAETRPTATQLLQHPFLQKASSVSSADAGKWFEKLKR